MGFEDNYLKTKYGNKRPFKVPDGYFDSLESQIMDRLQDNEVCVTKNMKHSLLRTYRYVAAAACLCAILVGVAIYTDKTSDIPSKLTSTVAYDSSYDVIDYVTDRGIVDNDDIYALLSEN